MSVSQEVEGILEKEGSQAPLKVAAPSQVLFMVALWLPASILP